MSLLAKGQSCYKHLGRWWVRLSEVHGPESVSYLLSMDTNEAMLVNTSCEFDPLFDLTRNPQTVG